MQQTVGTNDWSIGNHFGTMANPEMSLLGDLTRDRNQTRVMFANLQSRHVSPADLDAFLQGYFNAR